ncbi:MAG: glycosyltransferase family 4 protein [Candidatus Hydrothermae bacterium]|nr:glycosyltransferase family 4 protein [Candidatus Hydrothermae bacterium]
MRASLPLRVLHVVTAFPYREDDVLTPWLWGLLRYLRDSFGMDIHVLAASHRGEQGRDLWGFRVHRFRYAPSRWETFTYEAAIPEMLKREPWRTLLVPPYVLGGFLQAQRLARKVTFDVVHVHWPIPLAAFAFPFRRRKIPIFHTYYTAELTLARKIRPLAKPLVRTADQWVAISSYAADLLRPFLRSQDRSRIEILPFSAAIEAGTFRPPRTISPEPRILFVGRMVERKGVPVLLRAAQRLKNRIPSLRLIFVGDGPLRKTWEAQAHALGLQDRVTFTGKISQEALERAYLSSDIFVLPAIVDSRGDTEGLGVVLLEALQYGLPVIASRVGGIVDIVQHESTGLLVPPGDPEALAHAIQRLVDHPEFTQTLVLKGQQHLKKNFTLESIAKRLVDLYRRLQTSSRSTP